MKPKEKLAEEFQNKFEPENWPSPKASFEAGFEAAMAIMGEESALSLGNEHIAFFYKNMWERLVAVPQVDTAFSVRQGFIILFDPDLGELNDQTKSEG